MAKLVLHPSSWIYRRVESITYAPNGETRRRVSLDIRFPGTPPPFGFGTSSVLVPLAIIRKSPLARFDMRDAEGKALPVLETAANGRVAESVLLASIHAAYSHLDSMPQNLGQLVEGIVYASAENADATVRALDETLGGSADPAQQLVMQLAADLSRCFLLVVECSDSIVDQRTILKYEYEDAISLSRGTGRLVRPLRIQIDRPAAGDAGSYHLEVRAPDGVATKSLRVTSEGVEPVTHEFGGRGPMVHAHLQAERADFEAQVLLVPERRGTVAWAVGSSIAVTIGFLAGFLCWEDVHALLTAPGERGNSLATVLLALPAFLLVLLARTPEHFIVSKVLRPTRWILLLTSVLMLAGATVVIVIPPLEAGRWVMAALFVVEAALAVTAWLIRRQSDPGPMIRFTTESGGQS